MIGGFVALFGSVNKRVVNLPFVIGAFLRSVILAPVLMALIVPSINSAVAEVPDPGATYGDAMRWYSRAAEAGDGRAQYLLGLKHEAGVGVTASDRQAAAWYGRAAAQGHVEAQFKLALMYEAGRGVAVDLGEAVRLYRGAAESGLAAAQYNLGVAYLNGSGVDRDVAEAFAWIALAAEDGAEAAVDLRGRLAEVLTGDLEAAANGRAAELRARLSLD